MVMGMMKMMTMLVLIQQKKNETRLALTIIWARLTAVSCGMYRQAPVHTKVYCRTQRCDTEWIHTAKRSWSCCSVSEVEPHRGRSTEYIGSLVLSETDRHSKENDEYLEFHV